MADQLRTHRGVLESEGESSLKLTNEDKQKLIREFRNPMPDDQDRNINSTLTKNVVWCR